jgi:hypothetical protein
MAAVMVDDELRKELDELKQTVKAQAMLVQLLLQGGIAQNKRMDTLESFIVATSKLASVASDMISVHLDTLKELAKADMPLPPPPPHEKRQRAPEVA